ncbi:DUF3040 domain-containing protein [Amycolatopsis sp. NBC_00345]|uniref:DUF3040 domain-containing protein n=1 Tax=Amycolatopsis sp. NBC_00345 TaxID=2975955 RepID=UPI002E2655DA
MRRHERRQLREIERALLATDHAWARSVFGELSGPERRRRTAARVTADLAAVTVLAIGAFTVSMPTLFAGTVLANIALCCHLGGATGRSPMPPPA